MKGILLLKSIYKYEICVIVIISICDYIEGVLITKKSVTKNHVIVWSLCYIGGNYRKGRLYIQNQSFLNILFFKNLCNLFNSFVIELFFQKIKITIVEIIF